MPGPTGVFILYIINPELGIELSKVPVFFLNSKTKYSVLEFGEFSLKQLFVDEVIGFKVYVPLVVIVGMLLIQFPYWYFIYAPIDCGGFVLFSMISQLPTGDIPSLV